MAPNPGLRVLALALALMVGWFFIMRKIGSEDLYSYLGPYALLVLVLAGIWRGFTRGPERGPMSASAVATAPRTSPRARPAHLVRDVVFGFVVGTIMTVGTYAAYKLSVTLAPSLATHVEGLYRAANTKGFGERLSWTAAVIVAEEVLWRGALFGALSQRYGGRVAALLSLSAYVLVQVATGSWVVVLAAFICGLFWTAERLYTRSLVPSLVSHAIWTMTVIHLLPVTKV